MPRRLKTCLERLREWPTKQSGCYGLIGDEDDPIRRYIGSTSYWYQLNIQVPDTDRTAVAESEFLRHNLETHGALSIDEGKRINIFLQELDSEPLSVLERGMWLMFNDPESWKHSTLRGKLVSTAAWGAIQFEAHHGQQWTDDDELFYAKLLARISEDEHNSFEVKNATLKRILARSQKLSTSTEYLPETRQ